MRFPWWGCWRGCERQLRRPWVGTSAPGRGRRATVGVLTAAVVGATVGWAGLMPAGAAPAGGVRSRPMTGTLPPANPPANIPPDSSNIVQATDDARADEGVGPMGLNLAAFSALTVPEQVFVVENLERVDRGEPPISAMTAQLDSYAQAGADSGRDPTHPLTLTGGGVTIQGGSIWTGGTLSTLFANYLWMYEDGWGGSASATSNADCTSAGAGGCWAHRDIILTQYSNVYCLGAAPILVMGAAVNSTESGDSIAALFLSTCGPAPTDETYTWAEAQQVLGVASEQPDSTPDPISASGAGGTAASDTFSPVVAMAATPDGKGYWLVAADGEVSGYGDATVYGSMGGQPLNAPIVGMVSTADGRGYWLVASDGGIFSFGDAAFYGSTGSMHLNAPVVGMAAAPDGRGYWFVASDGGIFSFGDAAFYGSMGAHPLNQPVVGMATDQATGGYWLVAADGGIFSFGAPFYGSTGSTQLNAPIVGMEAAPDGSGYRFVASDGGIFSFDLPFSGSMGGTRLASPAVGMAASGGAGYWLVAADGGIFSFGAPFYGSAA
jgi:hypothetical protein